MIASEGLRRKAFFFISPSADEIETGTLLRHGEVVAGGVDVLVNAIVRVTANYAPPKFAGGLTALRELRLDTDCQASGTAAQRVSRQLVYGVLPEAQVLMGEMAFDEQPYLVIREQDEQARIAIKEGPWRDILFIGELASGKSASTLNLAQYLCAEGYRVFHAENTSALSNDLERISKYDDKIAIIFDGYSPFRKAIAEYVARRPTTHRLVLTESTPVHDLVGGFIDNTPHLGPTREIYLNKISDRDVQGFESLTNFGGFWEDRAGASVASRQRHISATLEGSLYRLLSEIIHSERVQAEIRELLRPLSYDNKSSKIFCSALIVNKLEFDFTISEWQYLFDGQAIRSMMRNYSDQVRHFIFSDYDHIYIRNGLLSSHILHAFMDDSLIKECLIDLYERAQISSGEPGKWRELMIELMRFGSIEKMFSGDSRASDIFSYYESIRVFGGTMDNPDYWLQLGIASTVLDDLERGELCFKNAYARERGRRTPNFKKIDNYAARFDMRRAISEHDSNAAFRIFIDANEKLVRQIFLDINRHYPFKTGRAFSDIAAKHYPSWNAKQQEAFRKAAFKIREKATEWKSANREHSPDVEILIKETTDLISRLGWTPA